MKVENAYFMSLSEGFNQETAMVLVCLLCRDESPCWLQYSKESTNIDLCHQKSVKLQLININWNRIHNYYNNPFSIRLIFNTFKMKNSTESIYCWTLIIASITDSKSLSISKKSVRKFAGSVRRVFKFRLIDFDFMFDIYLF
jgi:hypothetical protein